MKSMTYESTGTGIEPRKTEQVGGNVYATRRGDRQGVYIKDQPDYIASSEAPYVQAMMYKAIREYLKTPHIRLAGKNDFDVTRQLLYTVPAEGERADLALLNQPENFSRALHVFASDEFEMWKKKARSVEKMEESLKTDAITSMRRESVKVIQDFLTGDEVNQNLDLPININGRNYKSLRELCTECLAALMSNNDPITVVVHGDEHLFNLFISGNGEEATYQIIDPRRMIDRNSPAHVVNRFVGTSLLFVIDYDSQSLSKINMDGREELKIEYSVANRYHDGYARILSGATEFVTNIEALDLGRFMTKEYLFANMLRGYMGNVAPKNRAISEKNCVAYLAQAVELYSDFDGFLKGNYSGIAKN